MMQWLRGGDPEGCVERRGSPSCPVEATLRVATDQPRHTTATAMQQQATTRFAAAHLVCNRSGKVRVCQLGELMKESPAVLVLAIREGPRERRAVQFKSAALNICCRHLIHRRQRRPAACRSAASRCSAGPAHCCARPSRAAQLALPQDRCCAAAGSRLLSLPHLQLLPFGQLVLFLCSQLAAGCLVLLGWHREANITARRLPNAPRHQRRAPAGHRKRLSLQRATAHRSRGRSAAGASSCRAAARPRSARGVAGCACVSEMAAGKGSRLAAGQDEQAEGQTSRWAGRQAGKLLGQGGREAGRQAPASRAGRAGRKATRSGCRTSRQTSAGQWRRRWPQPAPPHRCHTKSARCGQGKNVRGSTGCKQEGSRGAGQGKRPRRIRHA